MWRGRWGRGCWLLKDKGGAPLSRAAGLPFVAHAENFFHAADIFRLRGKTVYELASTSKARLK
mgnify:CR=1 FL=1